LTMAGLVFAAFSSFPFVLMMLFGPKGDDF
jgi:hypothetical protein